jgi:hypothetical protein
LAGEDDVGKKGGKNWRSQHEHFREYLTMACLKSSHDRRKMLAGASKLNPLHFPLHFALLPLTRHHIVPLYCLLKSLVHRASAQQAADIKFQHAKEMKAKAYAYADAASPIKKPESPAKFPEPHSRKAPAAPSAKPSASSAHQSTAGIFCNIVS